MPKEKETKYRAQKYRKEWEKEHWARDWLTLSKNHNGKAYCNVCSKDLAVGNSELISHTKSAQHIRNMKTVETTRPVTEFIAVSSYSRIKAELNTVALVARKTLSFQFLDQLMETLHFVANDSKAINGMTCNATKGTYLMTECLATSAHESIVGKMKNGRGFSILCDKATDITMENIFCINVCFLDEDKMIPATYLYHLIPVEAGGADSLSLEKVLEEDGIGREKVIGYASDVENLMQGQNNSMLTRIKNAVPDIYILKHFCHSYHLVKPWRPNHHKQKEF